MAHINLLPWRAERRKQREREFFMQLGAAFVAALLVLFLWSFWMSLRIDNQNERNAYLQGEIKQLDERIAKIKDLEKVRQRLLARKQIIEQLQANRSQMVHLFDELVKTIPSSVRLTSMNQNGGSMVLHGVAQSNASVAEYMRSLDASPWMGGADLEKTQITYRTGRMPYTFGLNVKLSEPSTEEAGKTPVLLQGNPAPAAPASTAAHAAVSGGARK
ncbi:MAG TPA: PilN domain-containing protein [Frateuria sp.]|uniref:PilN domain-containing protein n=1 Tax=Frateuria sp. TaxID=2211372 RepID=UPI002DE844E1|nr:PilN domain-containing protein [Frateuria sp.]